DRSANFNATGAGFDQTVGTGLFVVDTTFSQSLNWTTMTYGHGFHDVIFKNPFTKSFSGNQWIGGNLLFDTSLGSTGSVSGSVNLYVGSLTDNSSVPNGAFQGSTGLFITTNVTSLPPKLVVNNLHFIGGGISTLNSNLTTNYVYVDSNSTLSLNGH